MSEEENRDKPESSKLRGCKLCGTEISPYSPFCRNCGHPQGRPLVIALLILFLLLLLAFYVGFVLFCSCEPERFEPHNTSVAPRSPEVGRVSDAGGELVGIGS
ncbi:MAG: zinc-ribbon domain-containing protein [Candidatus Brocadiia bacterium]